MSRDILAAKEEDTVVQKTEYILPSGGARGNPRPQHIMADPKAAVPLTFISALITSWLQYIWHTN